MSKILTISVAAYNVEPYIKQNIESILRLFIKKSTQISFMPFTRKTVDMVPSKIIA